LASSHLLVQTILVEVKSFDVKTPCVDWFKIVEGAEDLSTLEVEVSETVVNESLETLWRQSSLDEFGELCCGASSDEADFDHPPILST
jgi:hypothetical protein